MNKLIWNVFRAAILAVILLASQVAAQDNTPMDFEKWDSFAGQAEAALENPNTNSDTLNSIRTNAEDWRKLFDAGQGINAQRIQSVKDQIATLGPAPAEGATESDDVASRRKALNDQLSELQAPGLAATEALSRAASIVAQADEEIGQRKAEEIMTVSPSPLLPGSWIAAGKDLKEIGSGFLSDAHANLTVDEMREKLPKAISYLLAAIVLLTFGRRFVDSLPSRLGARAEGDARAVLAFIVSLGQILLPMVGVTLLAWGLAATGLFGKWATPFLLALPLGALSFFSGRWLVRTLFAATPVAYQTLNMPPPIRARARLYGTALAVMLALHVILANAALPLSGFVRADNALPIIPYDVSAAGAGVIHFLIMLTTAFALFPLANILRRMTRYDGTDTPPNRARVLAYYGGYLRILVVATLILSVIGFINFSNAVLWPSIKSLGLIGLLILLQDFIADLYALAKRGKDGAREALAPLLIGLLLIVASVPVFALLWGASPAELATGWTRIMNGVSLGGITLSPGAIITFGLVFGFGYLLTRWIQGGVRTQILPRTRLDKGAQNAAVSGLGYVGIFLAALFAINSAGINLSNLALVASALSVGIGFGLQTVVQNFVAGIILLVERPISVGDWVEAGGQQGIVQSISVRSTRIKTFDQTDVIVPNSDLISQSVTNWTRGNSRGRIIVKVGVAYGSDTRKVEKILREIAEDQPTVLIEPPPAVLLTNFGADSLDFEIRCILSDISGGVGVSSEIRHQIAQRFAQEGIEIPFAQRDLWFRNPETLFAKPSHAAPKPHEETPKPAEAQAVVRARPPADIRSVGEMPNDGDGNPDNDGDGDGDNT